MGYTVNYLYSEIHGEQQGLSLQYLTTWSTFQTL